MNNLTGRITLYILATLCFLGCFGVGQVIAQEETKTPRIMVLPFDGSSAEDFAYLTDSVRAMIVSRLAAKQDIEVVDYNISKGDLAALQGGGTSNEEIFTRLKTDYLLSGALYSLQTGLKVQVTLSGQSVDGSEAKNGVFTALAQNEARIISSVENLADDVVARGIGTSGSQQLLEKASGTDSEALSGFSTEHPERVYKKGLYSGAIVAEGKMEVESLGVRRSSDLPLTIVSMDTGDIDGDGKLEIVAASRTTLEVYRFEKTMFKKLHSHQFGKTYKIHAVNLADLNGDGRLEIYVSANDYIPASSAIFTWSETEGFDQQVTDIKYYIRPVEIPGEGLVLAGTRSTKNFDDGFVGDKVVKLVPGENGNGLVENEVIPLPRKVRLFDFVYADLDGNGGKELVSIDRNEKMHVYDSSNSLLWVSENDYGGSRNFLSISKSTPLRPDSGVGGDATDDRMSRRPYVYVPIRLLPVDLDNDGKEEILIGGNKRISPKPLVNFREYDGGSVVCLSWQEAEMVDLWRTNTVSGYLADFTFVAGEHTGGESEMYIAQVPDRFYFGFSFSTDSKMLQYRMNVK